MDCSRRGLLTQLDATLRELGTDHLDMWQVATWDRLTPVDEIADTLDFAVTSGRVRYTGARGYLGWRWQPPRAARGRGDCVATQAEYSLLARGVEEELLPAAAHHGIGVFAAVAARRRRLTGKYRDGIPADSRGADPAHASEVRSYLTESSIRVVDAVLTAADGLGTSPLAVALALRATVPVSRVPWSALGIWPS